MRRKTWVGYLVDIPVDIPAAHEIITGGSILGLDLHQQYPDWQDAWNKLEPKWGMKDGVGISLIDKYKIVGNSFSDINESAKYIQWEIKANENYVVEVNMVDEDGNKFSISFNTYVHK